MDKIKGLLGWVGKRKVLVISIVAFLVVAGCFLIVALPNLNVTSMAISVNETEIRVISYTPTGAIAVMGVGDSVGYSVSNSEASKFVFAECEYDDTVIELSGSKITAKQAGRAEIECWSKFKTDVRAVLAIQVEAW